MLPPPPTENPGSEPVRNAEKKEKALALPRKEKKIIFGTTAVISCHRGHKVCNPTKLLFYRFNTYILCTTNIKQ